MRATGVVVACLLGVTAAGADTRVEAVAEGRGPDAANDGSRGTARSDLVAILSESREKEVTQRLQNLASEREHLSHEVTVQGRAYVRLLRLGLLPLSSGFDGLVRHATRVEGLSRAIERRQELIRVLDNQASALKDGVVEAQRQRSELRVHLSEVQRSRDAILAAREREAAYRRAFGGQQGHKAVYSAPPTGNEEVNTFAELRGRLPLPVEGRAEVVDVGPSTTVGPSVRLRTEGGAIARCVSKGRVVLTGEHDGGGRAVVIDHGGGYTTVVGNLTRVHVHAGDEVASGAVLGEGAAVDGSGTVSFEVRKDGVNLFPIDWFGL